MASQLQNQLKIWIAGEARADRFASLRSSDLVADNRRFLAALKRFLIFPNQRRPADQPDHALGILRHAHRQMAHIFLAERIKNRGQIIGGPHRRNVGSHHISDHQQRYRVAVHQHGVHFG